MEKTEVLTGTMDDQLRTDLRKIISEESRTSRVLDSSDIDRMMDRVDTTLTEYRGKLEDEAWETWKVAQGFERDAKYEQYLDDKRILTAEWGRFRAIVGAYNREREKEGKTEHQFTSEYVEPEAPHEEHPDNCIHHDDDAVVCTPCFEGRHQDCDDPTGGDECHCPIKHNP